MVGIDLRSGALRVREQRASLGWDQRGIGFPRAIGGSVDIGAYQTNPDVIFINGFD